MVEVHGELRDGRRHVLFEESLKLGRKPHGLPNGKPFCAAHGAVHDDRAGGPRDEEVQGVEEGRCMETDEVFGQERVCIPFAVAPIDVDHDVQGKRDPWDEVWRRA